MSQQSQLFLCPQCGGEVKVKAKACSHCGSDEKTGWSEQTYLDGIDLTEEDFSETLKKEYGVNLERRTIQNRIFPAAAFVMIVLFFLFYILKC